MLHSIGSHDATMKDANEYRKTFLINLRTSKHEIYVLLLLLFLFLICLPSGTFTPVKTLHFAWRYRVGRILGFPSHLLHI
jgi:hypothetical protein